MDAAKKNLDKLKLLYGNIATAVDAAITFEQLLVEDTKNPFREMLEVQFENNLQTFTFLRDTIERTYVIIDIMKQAPKEFRTMPVDKKRTYMQEGTNKAVENYIEEDVPDNEKEKKKKK